jgi:WD40 repeat protein
MDKTVRLWDVGTRQATATFKGHRTYAHAVAFTPDGRRLASAGGDLYLRDRATGLVAVARQQAGEPAAGLVLSPDGRLIVTAGRRLGGANTAIAGDVRFWDAAAARTSLDASADQPRRKRGVELSPAAAACGEAALGEHLGGRQRGAWCIALDPAGVVLAIGTDKGGVLLWDVAARKPRESLAATAAVRSLAFSSDGRLLAAAVGSRVHVWDVRSGTGVAVLEGHEKQVWSVAYFPGIGAAGESLLSGSQDGTARVWDVGPARQRAVFSWSPGAVRAVAVAPDGMTAAAGAENGSIAVWDWHG